MDSESNISSRWIASIFFPRVRALSTNKTSVCVTGILRIVYSYNPKEPIAGRFPSALALVDRG